MFSPLFSAQKIVKTKQVHCLLLGPENAYPKNHILNSITDLEMTLWYGTGHILIRILRLSILLQKREIQAGQPSSLKQNTNTFIINDSGYKAVFLI